MSKKVAILQSNYIPWKGYFDLIAAVDEFILYDDMQYTRRDWRNRNKIKTSQGLKWLSVPVHVKGRYYQKISETKIYGSSWQKSHWQMLKQNYGKAPCFDEVSGWLAPIYMERQYGNLSDLNKVLISNINMYLGINTKITYSRDYDLVEGKTEKLISLCLQAGGNEYISGPAAKSYIDESLFAKKGIKLTWFSYDDYPEYSQLYGGFEHGVTILDLLFNCGRESHKYMKYIGS